MIDEQDRITATMHRANVRAFVDKVIRAVATFDEKYGPFNQDGDGTPEAESFHAYMSGLETISNMNCGAMAMTVRDVIASHESPRDRTDDLCKRLNLDPR